VVVGVAVAAVGARRGHPLQLPQADAVSSS
jgi:hypothetical protein